MSRAISEKVFGNHEGMPVIEYTIHNAQGMEVSVINYGATITKIISPDKNDDYRNITFGFDDPNDYFTENNPYLGSIVGRYCNRIANGKFLLDGKEYLLAKNNNGNHLHGGLKGFDKSWWNIEKQETDNSLRLTYLSEDGEEGFPGNLLTTIIYKLTDDNALKIDYTAITDQPTPVNLTSHCYFNLSGEKHLPILDHELKIFADQYTITNENLIPTGEIASLKNTALDFTSAKKIGQDIESLRGYDHNIIINKKADESLKGLYKTACLYEPVSGRFMEMFTTEPAVQFYTARFKNPETKKEAFTALCLESQHYPNSPNEPSFPNTILRPGDVYRQTTVYKFSVKRS